MGWGLGRNSPVVLSLGKANFEAMIDRHGQWVRWRVARKCPCLTTGSRISIARNAADREIFTTAKRIIPIHCGSGSETTSWNYPTPTARY
jgi:hypothetical protein